MRNIITEKKRENSVRLDFCWGGSFRSTESAHQEWEKSSLRKWEAQDIRSGRLSFLSWFLDFYFVLSLFFYLQKESIGDSIINIIIVLSSLLIYSQ
jgi:hypothetical protein